MTHDPAEAEVVGYVIRGPGEYKGPSYYFGKDAEELKQKYFEGFNPVYKVVRMDSPAAVGVSMVTREQIENIVKLYCNVPHAGMVDKLLALLNGRRERVWCKEPCREIQWWNDKGGGWRYSDSNIVLPETMFCHLCGAKRPHANEG